MGILSDRDRQAVTEQLAKLAGPVRLVTFGAQDYVGDDHFAMYTPETLSNVLRAGGFEDIVVLATDRMNGLCPELEITATAGSSALRRHEPGAAYPSVVMDAA